MRERKTKALTKAVGLPFVQFFHACSG